MTKGTALFLAGWLACAAAAPAAEIRARFIGNMALQLSDGKLTLRSDFPYEYHHQNGEAVPEIQGRELPRQGDELVFSKE